MKKILCYTFILCFVFLNSHAQKENKKYLNEIKKSDSIVCFGIDFSISQFIGDFPDRNFFIDTAFVKWNLKFVGSDLLKVYREKQFLYDFSCVTQNNNQINEKNFNMLYPLSLSLENIQSVVNKYNPVIGKGKGIVFVVESFNKNNEEAKIWFVYFQIETNKIIYAKSYVAQAIGINFVNHWGNAIEKVVKQTAQSQNRLFWEGLFFAAFITGIAFFILTTY